MIVNNDIIVVGIQAWDIEIGSNCKNIAVEMSRLNRVLYVNPPLDRISEFKERKTEKVQKRLRIKSGKDADLVQINPNLWTLYPKTTSDSINWIASEFIFDFINKRNGKKFANSVKSAIQRLDFKNYIIFNDSSMFLGQHLQEFLQPKMYVYYMRDYLTKNPYWKKHGVRLEPKLISNANLVVNNSTLYADYGATFNKHSYMVGQGCDTTLFNDLERDIVVPKDLQTLPKPIIGYVGFLSSRRLSIEIIEHIALVKPEWSIVLVGPEDDKFKSSNLHQLQNVYFLGSREAPQLPNYIKGFDVAMNPQLINDATIGNYPRKIDEYLAMGKPTLATATKAMEYFENFTYLGTSKEDYVLLAEKALKENNKDLEMKRSAYGRSHSWENNVKEIYQYIQIVAQETGIKIE